MSSCHFSARIVRGRDPDLGGEYREYQDSVLGECSLPSMPAHDVTPQLLRGLPFLRQPLHVKLPRGLDGCNAHEYFSCDPFGPRWLLRGLAPQTLIGRYLVSLDDPKRLTQGCVQYESSRQLKVKPGVRRVPCPSPQKIAEGVFYYQLECPEWTAAAPRPNFYAQCVAPHLKEETAEPVKWAADRMAIVLGYAAELFGRDYPPAYAEYPYRQMAALVCNPAARCLLLPRTYHLTAHRRELINNLKRLQGNVLSPEAVMFLMENDAVICPEDFKTEPFRNFLAKLPEALENGLIIDRVSELLLAHLQHGAPPKEALRHTVSIAAAVYAQGPKPWWFKEDFDLRPEGADAFTPTGRAASEFMARLSGFGYQYARELYRHHGAKLAAFKGLAGEDVISFGCAVARDYGIGNIQRTGNVLEYAAAYMEELPPSARRNGLRNFQETLHRHRPLNEIIGLLEGPEVNFEKPGLFGMVAALMQPQAEREKLDELTIRPIHLQALTAKLLSPLAERARIRPALAVNYQAARLLTEQHGTGALALPLGEEAALGRAAKGPLSSWLEFDRRLHKECRFDPCKVAGVYFTFYAHKMPDAFGPPPGFLRFLEKFEEIPNPKIRFPGLEHPFDRAGLKEQNTRNAVDRYTLVSNLLDAWVMGIVEWAKLERVFDWVTADLPWGARKRIEIQIMWQSHENPQEVQRVRARRMAEKDRELLAEIRIAQIRHAWAEHEGGNGDSWAAQELERLKNKRARLLAGAEEEAYGDFEEPPSQKERARRQQEDEKHLDWDVQSGTREREESLRLARLQALERAVAWLMQFNAGVVAGVVPLEPLKNSFGAYLRDIMRGKRIKFGAIPASMEKAKELVFDFREAAALQVFDPIAANQAWQECQTAKDIQAVMGGFLAARECFVRARQKTGEAALWLAERIKGRNMSAEIAVRREELLKEITEDLKGVKFLAPDAANRIVGHFFWVGPYAEAFSALAELRQQAPWLAPASQGTPARHSVQAANSCTVSIWHLCCSLHGGREEVGEARDQARLEFSAGTPAKGTLALCAAGSSPELDRRVRHSFDLEAVLEVIRRSREETFGLLPVGGKIHVLHPVDSKRFGFLTSQLGFSTGYFRLLHADTSVILPAMPSAGELKVIIGLMAAEKIIDLENPELQIGIAGRLDPDACAVLGASILLSTEGGVRYSREAFRTSHDSDTGCRIMAYDANGPRSKFPFDTAVEGRTDILGRRHLSDLDRYQLLGTVLVRAKDGGPLGHLAGPYIQRLREILGDFGLAQVLDESWVNVPGRAYEEDAGLRHFERAIMPCTEAWFGCNQEFERTGRIGGVVSEVQKLFDWLREEAKVVQTALLNSPGFREQREILFTFGGNYV